MSNPHDRLWGDELSKQTRLRSGALYPILHRMLDEGWLVDGWEDLDHAIDKRPPRDYDPAIALLVCYGHDLLEHSFLMGRHLLAN